MSSDEFLSECSTNSSGKNVGKHSLWFNGYKTDKKSGLKVPYASNKYKKYIATDFSRFK